MRDGNAIMDEICLMFCGWLMSFLESMLALACMLFVDYTNIVDLLLYPVQKNGHKWRMEEKGSVFGVSMGVSCLQSRAVWKQRNSAGPSHLNAPHDFEVIVPNVISDIITILRQLSNISSHCHLPRRRVLQRGKYHRN